MDLIRNTDAPPEDIVREIHSIIYRNNMNVNPITNRLHLASSRSERGLRVPPMPSQAPNVGLQIFNRIHSTIANAERRLLMTPDERNRNIFPNAIQGDPNVNDQHQGGPLPRQGAPIEFTCGVCMEKIRKGTPQQILTCGHKFCANCFDQWHNRQGHGTTCPTCRTPVYNSSMTSQPMATPSTAHPSSRFRGTNRMTPQQEAMTMFMRNLHTSRRRPPGF